MTLAHQHTPSHFLKEEGERLCEQEARWRTPSPSCPYQKHGAATHERQSRRLQAAGIFLKLAFISWSGSSDADGIWVVFFCFFFPAAQHLDQFHGNKLFEAISGVIKAWRGHGKS